MHINSIAVTCLLVPALWVVMSLPSLAASMICWLDNIAKAEGGIDVYFIQQAALCLIVIENGSPIRCTVSDGVVYDEADRRQDHLFVKNDVEFYATQLTHDSCSYKVGANETIGKVTAKSAMRLPGLQPIFTAETIGTDGSVSQPEASSGP